MTGAAPRRPGLPDWVARRLIAQGLMDEATGATRRARAVACEQCGLAVWRGIDEDYGGMVADCDPLPLSSLGETQAVIMGRRTYELSEYGGRLEVTKRNSGRRRTRPVGTKRMDVVVGHQCGNTQQFDTDESNRPGRAGKTELPDEPPF